MEHQEQRQQGNVAAGQPDGDGRSATRTHQMRRRRRSPGNSNDTRPSTAPVPSESEKSPMGYARGKPLVWAPGLIGVGLGVLLAWAWLLLTGQAVAKPGLTAVGLFAFSVVICLAGLFLILRARRSRGSRMAAHDHDLAQRLEALEDQAWEIRESEEIHRSLLEAFGDVVLHRDPVGRIVFANKNFSRYFRHDAAMGPEELPVIDVSPSGDTTKPVTRELELATRMGKRWFSWTDLPVRDSDTGQTGVRSVGRDITERKIQEQALVKARKRAEVASEAKSRFLATMTHEIRTPLNGVLGMAQLLQAGELDPSQKSYVEAIRKSGDTLMRLIDDVLDTAQIESGSMTLVPKPARIDDLVEEVAEILGPRALDVAHGKFLTLATYVDPSLREPVMVDAARLKQVLLNLVGNALKFTDRGGIGLEAQLLPASGRKVERQRILFRVCDSGPGLSEQDQGRIFGEFVQSEEGATRRHGGTGLGLAISSRIVRLMGGQIRLESAPGRGSVFEFVLELPLAANSRDEAVEPDTVTMKGPLRPALRDHAIDLIMPPSPARQAMVKTLRAEGAVVAVCDGMTEWQNRQDRRRETKSLRDRHVILDHANAETSRAFLARSQQGQTVYLLTHDALRGDTPELMKAGLGGWLTKPVRRSSLVKVLGRKAGLSQEESPASVGSLQGGSTKTAQPLNILLAEDNAINALLAKSLFEKLGHTVVHVETGEAAVAAYVEGNFDAVFMDMHMPVMDGLEAVGRIRDHEACMEANQAVPIIVLSADVREETQGDVRRAGADRFLLKPLDLAMLAGLVDELAVRSEIA